MKTYGAPWSTSLKVISALTTVLCVVTAVGLLGIGHDPARSFALLPLGLVSVGALFAIRGYAVTPDAILVRRLLWTTRLPRAGLQAAQFRPDAMRRSLRLLGNGGLFAFAGWFRNRELGTYRALVTDPRRTLVLQYAARTCVISPAAPEEFIRDLGVPSPAT
jgi:hypothetical protein